MIAKDEPPDPGPRRPHARAQARVHAAIILAACSGLAQIPGPARADRRAPATSRAAAPPGAHRLAGAQGPRPETSAPPTRSLTLAEAVRAAREREPSLVEARAATAAAAARERTALSALLPQLTGSASYARSTFNAAGGPSSLRTIDNYVTVGLTASELLYDFGQTSGKWRAARASAEAQRATERDTGLKVVLAVHTSYFNTRAAKDLMGVARDNLANLEAHLRQIQAFVVEGTRAEIDLAQARTDRANGRVQLIKAQNDYETAKAQLNQAMGVEGPTDYDVADEVLPPIDGEDRGLDPLLDEALRGRPDIAALDRQVRAQELTLSAARGAYGPSLGVSTGIADEGTSLGSTTWNWNATLTLTWNLFQAGLTRGQVAEAGANVDSARARRDQLRQQARLEVEQARLAVRAAKASLDAAGEALVNARVRLRLAEGRYRAGAGSIIELGDAQMASTNAAAQRVKAEYDLASARAQLLRALGRDLAR
jgi:outer membrane protein